MMMIAYCENFKCYRKRVNGGDSIYCVCAQSTCYASLTTKEDIVVKINDHKIKDNENLIKALLDSQPNFSKIVEISDYFVETWIENSVYPLVLWNQYDNGYNLKINKMRV